MEYYTSRPQNLQIEKGNLEMIALKETYTGPDGVSRNYTSARLNTLGKFDEATWHVFGLVGLTPSFLRQHDRGMAGVQQNISYKHELRAGDIIAIRSGILEMREKVIRFFHEMRNEETDQISAVAELIAVHIDTKTRKSCPFPKEILKRGRSMIVDHDPGTQAL